MMKRVVSVVIAVVLLGAAACAGAPHGSAASATPLTSVDTAYYEVPGSTRAEWAVNLPRAARAAGITSGGAAYTVGNVMWTMRGTRTTSIGCEVDGSVVMLRMGHVMPRLRAGAAPSASDRAAWDEFVSALWTRAHAREVIGERLADELRRDMRHTRTTDCQQLLVANRAKLDAFPARFSEAVREEAAAHATNGEFSPEAALRVP